MKNNYKIVAVTPAGRKRYLEILYKYICKNKHILDRWDLWVNTDVPEDLDYIKSLAENDSFVNLVYSDFPYKHWCNDATLSISPFWTKATDEDTIYIRFDDDVVYIDNNTIEKVIDFRIKYPQYLFVYPFIINNTHHSRNLQDRNLVTKEFGMIKEEKDLMGQGIYDKVGLYSGEFLTHLHETFFKYQSNNTQYLLSSPVAIIWEQGSQISINSVCWFGSFFKKICPLQNGNWPVCEEDYLTIKAPKELNMNLCTVPNTLIVHFLFGTQRKASELYDVLEKYKKIADV